MTLPLGAILSRLTGARLIYDPHELETERNGLRGVAKRISKVIERTFISFPDSVLFVNAPIAEWYRAQYGSRLQASLHVVYNFPKEFVGASSEICLRRFAGAKESDLVFVSQGILTRGRGIDLLLNAFEGLPPDRHLVFLGDGPLAPKIREVAARNRRVHLHPFVPPSQVTSVTGTADVGLVLIEPSCLSYEMATPNKLFETVEAGIPILACRLPAIREFVERNNLGWTVELDAAELHEKLAGLTREICVEKKKSVQAKKGRFVWSTQEPEFLLSYLGTGVAHA